MDELNIFYKIFIQGDAWRTVLKGLWVTMEITCLSLCCGTALGALICFLRLSKYRGLRLLAIAYIAVVRGAPVLMLLMLLFYGLFAGTGVDAVTVAVTAFSLHTAAYVAELIRGALQGVDYGQVEAARILGFSKIQAFRLITLPQLYRIARPVYQSTLINLMQWTSVVGYITITDLTRVIHHTASRTMQPMLTILGGMVLYLTLSYLVHGIFALLDWREQRRRQ